jgi:hypothetical protein
MLFTILDTVLMMIIIIIFMIMMIVRDGHKQQRLQSRYGWNVKEYDEYSCELNSKSTSGFNVHSIVESSCL